MGPTHCHSTPALTGQPTRSGGGRGGGGCYWSLFRIVHAGGGFLTRWDRGGRSSRSRSSFIFRIVHALGAIPNETDRHAVADSSGKYLLTLHSSSPLPPSELMSTMQPSFSYQSSTGYADHSGGDTKRVSKYRWSRGNPSYCERGVHLRHAKVLNQTPPSLSSPSLGS